jgi:hypothetical protein
MYLLGLDYGVMPKSLINMPGSKLNWLKDFLMTEPGIVCIKLPFFSADARAEALILPPVL